MHQMTVPLGTSEPLVTITMPSRMYSPSSGRSISCTPSLFTNVHSAPTRQFLSTIVLLIVVLGPMPTGTLR